MAVDKNQKNLVPMILKTFEVLEVFRERPRGLTYMELVEYYPHISRVSLYRILCSLEKLGYLRKDEHTSRYELGAKFIELGRITEQRQDIVRIARPYMERILEEFGENVNLARISDGELVYLTIMEGSHPLRLIETPGRRQALYSSALGKAILAWMDEPERERIIARLKWHSMTPQTIAGPDQLRADLELIRQRGWALDCDENLIGVSCAGAAIRNADGRPIAAISVTGPSARNTSAKLDEIGPRLHELTNEISREHFGWAG